MRYYQHAWPVTPKSYPIGHAATAITAMSEPICAVCLEEIGEEERRSRAGCVHVFHWECIRRHGSLRTLNLAYSL